MKLESLQLRLRNLLLTAPGQQIVPPEPWTEQDMDNVARLIQDFVDSAEDVIEDTNPWRDWLDRWRFYQATRK